MERAVFEDVRVEGHLIDSGIMSQVMDDIIAQGRRVRVALLQRWPKQRRRVRVRAARIRREPGGSRFGSSPRFRTHGAVAYSLTDALHMFAAE